MGEWLCRESLAIARVALGDSTAGRTREFADRHSTLKKLQSCSRRDGLKTLKVWELASGRELHTLTGHPRGVNAVAVTADGERAVSASSDNTVKLWDLETGKVLVPFTCDSAAHCCAFSDALKLIVPGDAGGHVHFLSLEEPKPKF